MLGLREHVSNFVVNTLACSATRKQHAVQARREVPEAKRSEFNVCKFITEAIIIEGSDVGTIHDGVRESVLPDAHPKRYQQRRPGSPDEARFAFHP